MSSFYFLVKFGIKWCVQNPYLNTSFELSIPNLTWNEKDCSLTVLSEVSRQRKCWLFTKTSQTLTASSPYKDISMHTWLICFVIIFKFIVTCRSIQNPFKSSRQKKLHRYRSWARQWDWWWQKTVIKRSISFLYNSDGL